MKKINDAELYERALEVAQEPKVFFIKNLCIALHISRKRFYDTFPLNSEKYNSISEILENKRHSKVSDMVEKWSNSNIPVLEISAAKILGGEEIRKALSTNYSENKNENKNKNTEIPAIKITIDNEILDAKF